MLARFLHSILFSILFLFFAASSFAQIHPITYNTKEDFKFIKKAIPTNKLLNQSFQAIKQDVDQSIGKDIDVPVPKDLAGGYTHEKHKENYMLLFNSSILYQLTGEVKYAEFAKGIFNKYAVLNPTLKDHPKGGKLPGRIFYQSLNDAVWLVYAGLAFDGIHDYLTLEERQIIAKGVFKPEVDFFTGELKNWFALIHNHAVWACAGVGIVGIATDNEDYVQMALYGQQKDGKKGFIANINGLFSPNGYYTEGPYYNRYSILPFYLFGNALNHYKPSLKIFSQKDNVLHKALVNMLQQTNYDGGFYSYNDAIKDKNFLSNEVVEAIDIAWTVYGATPDLLPVAKQQNRVTLTCGGALIAKDLVTKKEIAKSYPYRSVEFTDGANGDEGGVSILRDGSTDSLMSLIFKYTSHGLSHGHYDKLNINLYDGANEILPDYGAVRYINIEQKSGGRYLPETKTYAAQTIAHNTIVVDEKSDFDGIEEISQQNHSNKVFSSIGTNKVQVVSAEEDKAYPGVKLQRTEYMLSLPNPSGNNKPLIIDIFRANSTDYHQYDLPFQYLGTLIQTSFPYKPYTNNMTTMGTRNGYQHLWKEAEGKSINPLTQFTFLNHNTYYTISSLTDDSTLLYLTRIGANDPDFNLRHDPAFIIRKKGTNQAFLNVIETHGNYNSVSEISTNTYSSVSNAELLQNNDDFSVATITFAMKKLLIIQCNKDFTSQSNHEIIVNNKTYSFKGAYSVWFDGKQL